VKRWVCEELVELEGGELRWLPHTPTLEHIANRQRLDAAAYGRTARVREVDLTLRRRKTSVKKSPAAELAGIVTERALGRRRRKQDA